MRTERETILKTIRQRLEDSSYVFVADYAGASVADLTTLRQALAPLQAELHVVKNTFLKRAADSVGWQDFSAILAGPSAMITGGADVVEIAKTLALFAKTHKKAELKGGCLEGKAITSEDVGALAKLPPRKVMLGMFVGTVAAPMTQLVGVMNQKVLSLLYVLKAVEEKKQAAA